MNQNPSNQEQHSSQLFVLTDQTKYNFKHRYQKILGFSPMLNNTCVILAIKSHNLQCVAHIDLQGNVLKELTYRNSNLFSYGIISQKQIIWLNVDDNAILQWNLQTYELLQFDFKFLGNQISDTHEIFVFPETSLICIAEWGNHNSNILKLTYYNYPLTQESEPVQEPFESDQVWNYQHMVRRANVGQKIVWFKSTQKQSIEFKTYQLLKQGNQYIQSNQNLKIHRVLNPFLNGNHPAQLSIGNIWQMSPGKYMIISITNRPTLQNQYPNSFFVYQQNDKLLRQAKFKLDGKYRFQIVDYFSFGNTSMIKTFDFQQGNAKQSPVYFINNQKQCIAARQTWKCSHLNKYTFPAYDSNLIVDAQYQNGNVSWVNSRMIRVVSPVQIAIFWMQIIVDDVDQDLLYMISKMI